MGWESDCPSAVLLSRLTTVACGRRQMVAQAPPSRFPFLAVRKASRVRRHGEKRLTRIAERKPAGLIRGIFARHAAPSVCGPCINAKAVRKRCWGLKRPVKRTKTLEAPAAPEAGVMKSV